MTLYLIIVALFNHICDFISLNGDFISHNVTLFLVIMTLYLKIVTWSQLQFYVSQCNFISHIITLYLIFVTNNVLAIKLQI